MDKILDYIKSSFISSFFSILVVEIILELYFSFSLKNFILRAVLVISYYFLFSGLKYIGDNNSKNFIYFIINNIVIFFILLISLILLDSILTFLSMPNIIHTRQIIFIFLLSLILYVCTVEFFSKYSVYIIFTLCLLLYLSAGYDNKIIIYSFIISFFLLLLTNREAKVNYVSIIFTGIPSILIIFTIAFMLPTINSFNLFGKGNNSKYNAQGNPVDIYSSKEKNNNNVLYTFKGDNPKYFISEAYDIIEDNTWIQSNKELFLDYREENNTANYASNNRMFITTINESLADKEYYNVDITKDKIDIINNGSEEIKKIKSLSEYSDIKMVEITMNTNKDSKNILTYIHPTKDIEYKFSDCNSKGAKNGFNKVYSNLKIKVNEYLTKKESVNNSYKVYYTDDSPDLRSEDYYIMTNMNDKLETEINKALIDTILQDESYKKRMESKEFIYDLLKNSYKFENSTSSSQVMSGNGVLINSSDNSIYRAEYDNFKVEYENGEIKDLYDKDNNEINLDNNEEFYLLFYDFLVLKDSDGNLYLNEEFENNIILDYFSYKDNNEFSTIINNIYSYEDFFLNNSGITDKMEKIAFEITENEETNYNKAKAIEDYFKNSDYEYSLDVEHSNLDNPIEYFIFNGKKGYCIQYATAMVLLCRSLNIPARYIEGYYVTEADKVEDTYEVKESNAHAFVQVYLSGYGWKNFDPTPGFGDENSITESITAFNEDEKGVFSGVIYALFVITVSILFISILVKVTYRYRKLRKILKLPNEEALEKLIGYSVELLRLCNINYVNGETELEFAERVDTILNVEFKNSMQEYYEYKYALKSISNEDVNKALDINKFIYRYLKKNKKKLNQGE